MTSKTKALKKGKYISGNKPAPAKAETPSNVNRHRNDEEHNEAMHKKMQNKYRRLRSLKRLGFSDEEIVKIFKDEAVRTVLCTYYGTFTVEDGTKTIKKRVYDKDHHFTGSYTEEDVPNILRGRAAVEKFLKDNDINVIAIGPAYCWIKTDVDNVDKVTELLKPIGRTNVNKPEPVTKESLEKKQQQDRRAYAKAHKKPSNNTDEAKAAAKSSRKAAKKKAADMRPYYAAKRKGGVSKRIKKFNKPLAEKIEKWLKEQKAAEASRKKGSIEERAKHRQLTSTEMKANKRARKAAKCLATKERRKEAEKKAMERNAAERAKRAQKAKKPTQTELKMAA